MPAAKRAIPISIRNLPVAVGTEGRAAAPGYIHPIVWHNPAPAAFQKDLSFSNPQDRDEEKGQVVVKALHPGRLKAADRAYPLPLLKLNCLGLNTSDEEKHNLYPASGNILAWRSVFYSIEL
jgi:hypothetical protein